MGAPIWLSGEKMSWAIPVAVLSVTVAVAPPLSSTISTPPIRKRFHMPSHREGGRSSSIGCHQGAAHRAEQDWRRRAGALIITLVHEG